MLEAGCSEVLEAPLPQIAAGGWDRPLTVSCRVAGVEVRFGRLHQYDPACHELIPQPSDALPCRSLPAPCLSQSAFSPCYLAHEHEEERGGDEEDGAHRGLPCSISSKWARSSKPLSRTDQSPWPSPPSPSRRGVPRLSAVPSVSPANSVMRSRSFQSTG